MQTRTGHVQLNYNRIPQITQSCLPSHSLFCLFLRQMYITHITEYTQCSTSMFQKNFQLSDFIFFFFCTKLKLQICCDRILGLRHSNNVLRKNTISREQFTVSMLNHELKTTQIGHVLVSGSTII